VRFADVSWPQLVHLLCDSQIAEWRGSPFVSTVSATPVEIGRPESIDRAAEPHTIRVSPHLGTLVDFSILLDKLGVTGSSPVPPTIMKAPHRWGFLRPGCDWLQALNRGRGKRMARFKATTSPTDPSGLCSGGRRSAQHVPRSDCAHRKGKSRTSANRPTQVERLLAMQKVVGSSPIIRSHKGPAQGSFCWLGSRRQGAVGSRFGSVRAAPVRDEPGSSGWCWPRRARFNCKGWDSHAFGFPCRLPACHKPRRRKRGGRRPWSTPGVGQLGEHRAWHP
jgi:hypothetical protein